MRQIITSQVRVHFHTVICAAAVVCPALLVLLLPWPRRLSLAFRYEFLPVLPVVFAAFFFLFLLPPRWRRPLSLFAAIFIFLIPLAALWVSGANEPNTVFGLLPWFDARGYFSEASRLLDGIPFSEISARRPLFPAFFAALLGFTGRRLMVTLALLAIINALAAWTFACEIRRRWGPAAGALCLTLVFFFQRRFTGTILTESLGLPLALFGFTLLFQSIEKHKPGPLFLASFLLTLAMNIRPGAFFTLPALALWAGFQGWRQGGWKTAVRSMLAALGGIASGFLLNFMVYMLLTSHTTQPFSNFSYTLYGLVVGGKGWTRVFSDHPEVNALLESERASLVYRLTIEEFLRDPSRLMSGILLAFRAMLMPSASGLFGFAGRLFVWEGSLVETAFRIFLFALSLPALLACRLQNFGRFSSLFLFLTAGLLLSSPFAPPWDADHMRAYAASIPLVAVLPSAGLGVLIPLVRKVNKPPEPPETDSSFTVFSGLALVFTASVIPLFIFFLSSRPTLPQASCPAGQEPVMVRLNPGSGVHIWPDDQLSKTRLPNLRQNDFSNSLIGFPESHSAVDFKDLSAPAAVYAAVDLSNGEEIWLVFSEFPARIDSEVQNLCGHFSSSTVMSRLFRVDSSGP